MKNKGFRLICFFLLLFSCTALKYERKDFPEGSFVVPRGHLEVRVLTNREIVLVGDYNDFIRERFLQDYGPFLKMLDHAKKTLAPWSRDFYYTFAGSNEIIRYRPYIAKKWQNKTGFQLVAADGKKIQIQELGYWLNAIGQARFQDMKTGEERLTKNADAAHFAFLTLAEPLTAGTWELTIPTGQTVHFRYHPENTISHAIKYNQLGYAPQAGRKYAYLGAWKGSAGPMAVKELIGKPFELIDPATGKSVFKGLLQPRQPDVLAKNGAPFSGEETLEMDFSSFQKPGIYYLHVPQVGRTPDFRIGNEAVGEAFFIHARGLYHQRCGVPKEKPYTNWTAGACHVDTRQGNFPPDSKDYGKSRNPEETGFRDANGKSLAVKAFDIIGRYHGTGKLLPGVRGGWHDAADYDRREQHLDAVSDLLAAWLLCSQNFTDGQLNLPESGNGIPDLVDEAIFGMEVWRKGQRPDGGVGMWIETNSHPVDKSLSPDKDPQKYYLSAATRNSSMDYAGHAAMLAWVLKKLDRPELSLQYLDSAKRAYDFAMNPANRFKADYTIQDGRFRTKNVHFQEPPELNAFQIMKAAFDLYLLTGADHYRTDILSRTKAIERSMGDLTWRETPFSLIEFQLEGKKYPEFQKLYKRYETVLLKMAKDHLDLLNNSYAYRISWYPHHHPFVTHMSWGVSHPLARARTLIAAWKMTGEKKYRDGAYLANDYHNGANQLGLTMTSGLGRIYPARYLHIPSYADGIAEFVPGITPYRNTYRTPIGDVQLGHGLYLPKRPSHGFKGSALPLLPETVTEGKALTEKETADKLAKIWPVWRRFSNLEAYTVQNSEFTVNETISPAAAVTGCLLEPGYMPSEALKNRKPADDIRKLPGYIPLP